MWNMFPVIGRNKSVDEHFFIRNNENPIQLL